MNSFNQKQIKSLLWAILAAATGTATTLAATLGISSSALASKLVFACSAEGVLVEVSRLNNGTLRYEAYNIPTTHQRPDLVINGGTVGSNARADTLYRFPSGSPVPYCGKPSFRTGLTVTEITFMLPLTITPTVKF